MDSSSDFGPVGGGLMVFHFCGKRGCLKIFKFFGEYIFSGGFRAKTAKGAGSNHRRSGQIHSFKCVRPETAPKLRRYCAYSAPGEGSGTGGSGTVSSWHRHSVNFTPP